MTPRKRKTLTAAQRAHRARQAAKKAKRDKRERELAAKIRALPDKRYGVILADPPWKFQAWSEETGLDRSADNHYSTQDYETIGRLDVGSIAARDCVLFLWATAPCLPQAIYVMRAWGFDYRTHAAWVKLNRDGGVANGTGYWFRGAHELLLVGARGLIMAPHPSDRIRSAILDYRLNHSHKPEAVAEWIEQCWPCLSKVELYRRGKPRPGWDAWGLEAEITEEEAA